MGMQRFEDSDSGNFLDPEKDHSATSLKEEV